MTAPVLGIHHVSAIAGEPQPNVDFCTGVLGLRLVKRTVNYDAPGAYHLYYGDRTGMPGTVLTYFPLGRHAVAGVIGAGQVSATAFGVPRDALDAWRERLEASLVRAREVERFGDRLLEFHDPDGVRLEIIGTSGGAGESGGSEAAVGPFQGATLCSAAAEATARLLGEMGYVTEAEEGARSRWRVGDSGPATRLELVQATGEEGSRVARGTVHHIAFGVRDEAHQLAWRERLLEAGYQVSPVMDRQYFQSIYFRERGGVLFEFATMSPGFTVDESVEDLGASLKLPAWLEGRRASIEAELTPLDI